ncbi:MAG: preprotein translocase subunit YajC [Alphaproteobacteria bacterium]|jgi:preprotein translocase subunit YajC|nr:preprotein translocase subunit YajC [Alphaproteobacteria bacterium]MBP9867688.1 preprotein translocase subunit YajC [Alphaproteobacteria bacterium]
MFINSAFAATDSSAEPLPETATTTGTTTPATVPSAPSAGEAFAMNIGMVLILVVLFYLLMIRPQQRRFKEHAEMLRKLDKGSKVVTQGGLVGVIEKVISDNDVLVDFGNGVKMTVLRSSVVGRYEEQVPPASKK